MVVKCVEVLHYQVQCPLFLVGHLDVLVIRCGRSDDRFGAESLVEFQDMRERVIDYSDFYSLFLSLFFSPE